MTPMPTVSILAGVTDILRTSSGSTATTLEHWSDPTEARMRWCWGVAKGIRSAAPEHRPRQTVELNYQMPAPRPTIQPGRRLSRLNGTYTYYPTYLQMWHSYNHKPVAADVSAGGSLRHGGLTGKPMEYGTPSRGCDVRNTGLCSAAARASFTAITTPDDFMPGWKSFVDTVGVNQFSRCGTAFFSSLPWQVIWCPIRITACGHGRVRPRRAPMTKTAPARWIFAIASRTEGRLPWSSPTCRHPERITVNMASLKAPATARWFDPVSGTYTAIAGSPFSNQGARQFTPPGNSHNDGESDWVLLLDASK